MTELETLLVIALVVMLVLYRIANNRAALYKCTLIGVGKGEISIEVDEANKRFCIVPNEKFFENISK